MNLKTKIVYLFLAVISLLAIFGATIYRLYALNWPGITLTLLFSAGGIFLFWKILKKEAPGDEVKIKKTWKDYLWTLPYFFFFIFCLIFLFRARNSLAITSPWQMVSEKFFISYALATAALVLAILKSAKASWLLTVHYFLTFSVLLLIFTLGFGYDPFIHQASLELIDKQGFIQPKEIFYLGYYAIIIIAHKLFFLPIIFLNKWLVPILAAVILPITIHFFLKKLPQLPAASCQLPIAFLLILPFSIFTISAPQNLAYLLLITAIFVGLTKKDRPHLILAWLLALACFAIHPIAGLPAMAFAASLSIWHLTPKIWQKIGQGAIFLGLAVILPLALSLSQSGQSGTEAPSVASAGNWLSGFSRQENLILNFINFFSRNLNIALIILAISAIAFSWFKRQKYKFLPILSGLSLSLMAAFFATKQFVDFNSLISYERGNYLVRILTTAFIFLLPAIILLIAELINKILEKGKFIKAAWLIFGILLITASLYCSYPRKDSYLNSRSFSVSRSDYQAINWIEKDAAGQSYAVLANQQVSVAALSTFGFGHYFKNYKDFPRPIDVYFYPIPTGGPLYQLYLDMVYRQADRKTAEKASQLTGAKTIYFVLNEYWWGFDKIYQEAKLEANSIQEIADGGIIIFKYSF